MTTAAKRSSANLELRQPGPGQPHGRNGLPTHLAVPTTVDLSTSQPSSRPFPGSRIITSAVAISGRP